MSETERDLVKSFVARIQDLDEDAKILNVDRRELYKEAKEKQFNTRALKRLVADLRKDEKETEVFEIYRSFVTGTPVATRPRAETPPQSPNPKTAVSISPSTDSGEPAPSSPSAPQPRQDGAGSSFHDPNDINDIRNHSFYRGPKAVVA